jgi:hypothetical protein
MGESESSADVVMDSVTPYSNWEQLDLNDNPSERFNCFITTAAGLLELDSVRKFEIKPYMTEYVRGIVSIKLMLLIYIYLCVFNHFFENI